MGDILVIEDDDLVRNVVERALRHGGYTARLGVDGPTGLELLATHGGALRAVFLDLTLPGMTGAEVLGHLKERAPTLPIVLSSGHDARSIPREVLAKATVFLEKPFRTNELLDAIKRAISGGR